MRDPIATDVAFALAALAAPGRRVPSGLMALLLGVAVVDDIAAIAGLAAMGRPGAPARPVKAPAAVSREAVLTVGRTDDHPAVPDGRRAPVAAAVVAVALVVGKAVGLTAGTALAVRLGPSSPPPGVRWPHIVGMGLPAGIGFTVSLFITDLAHDDPDLVSAARPGVLCGSVIAAAAGTVALRLVRR